MSNPFAYFYLGIFLYFTSLYNYHHNYHPYFLDSVNLFFFYCNPDLYRGLYLAKFLSLSLDIVDNYFINQQVYYISNPFNFSLEDLQLLYLFYQLFLQAIIRFILLAQFFLFEFDYLTYSFIIFLYCSNPQEFLTIYIQDFIDNFYHNHINFNGYHIDPTHDF